MTVWNEDPIASAEKEDEPPTRKARHKKTKKKRKEMTDREEIFEALAKLGHEPSYIELDGRPAVPARSLPAATPDLIFKPDRIVRRRRHKRNERGRLRPICSASPTLALARTRSFWRKTKRLRRKFLPFTTCKTPFFAIAYRGRIEHGARYFPSRSSSSLAGRRIDAESTSARS